MKYNLDVLSPLEFEKLSKDIISKKLNLEFKSFKMGKDGGIDLRNKENGIICQCKHVKKFSDLKSILKKELELSCPPAIKLYSFCPVFTGFFFICVRYAYDETEFRYDKALAMWVRTTN